MKIRFAVVAAASALATLPAFGADLQLGADTKFSISGFFAVGLKSATVDNTNRVGLKNEIRLDDNTSRIAFSGSSKIIDGWNAVFMVGSRFTTDVRPGDAVVGTTPVANASGWADDDTWAGISSPYGRVVFGKSSFFWADTVGLPHISPALDAPGENYRVWDVQGLSTFTILDQAIVIQKSGVVTNAYTLGITRSRNVVRYDSPNFSGVDFSVAWTKNAVGGEQWYPGVNTPNATYARNYEDGQTTYGRLRYNKNGISLIASILDQKLQGGVYSSASFTGPLDVTAYRLGGSYKFPFGLKVGLVMDTTTLVNGIAPLNAGVVSYGQSVGDAKRTAFEVPISYAWGDHMVHFTYAKAGNVSDAAASGANQMNFVYDYALNKRTFIGFVYTKLKNDTNGHYNPFLTSYSFGASQPNPLGATQATNTNGEGFTQYGINLQFWF